MCVTVTTDLIPEEVTSSPIVFPPTVQPPKGPLRSILRSKNVERKESAEPESLKNGTVVGIEQIPATTEKQLLYSMQKQLALQKIVELQQEREGGFANRESCRENGAAGGISAQIGGFSAHSWAFQHQRLVPCA